MVQVKTPKGISRIDQVEKRTYGFYVRVRFLGEVHSKFFSDKKHLSRDHAFQEAVKWRNATEKRLGKVRTEKSTVHVTSSSTGVVGVRLNDRLRRYEVSWVTREGKQGKTSVSISKHGIRQAFKKACTIRKEREAERTTLGV